MTYAEVPYTQAEFAQAASEDRLARHDDRIGLYLNPPCHPASPTEAFYLGGIVTIKCAECGHQVLEIAVAAAEPERTDNVKMSRASHRRYGRQRLKG